jgi:hypothetical protein
MARGGEGNAAGRAWRLPIKELKAPSLVDLVRLPQIFDRVRPRLREIARERLAAKVQYLLSKGNNGNNNP